MINTWAAEKRLYQILFASVVHRRIPIIDIPEIMGELGFTSGGEHPEMHLAERHPIINVLPDEKKPLCRMGVFTHETLHQLLTDFEYLKEVIGKHRDKHEQQIVALLANLVEDPAIEYFAPTVVGGEMLGALRFSIAHIYDCAPKLEESGGSAFKQMVNALIMLGDMGLIKGEFTNEEGKKYFIQIAPEFGRTIEEPDARKRIDTAEKWAVLTRPLWKKDAEDEEKFQQMLNDLLDAMLSGGMDGNGAPQMTPEKQPKGRESDKRRRQMIKALEDAQEEDGKDGSGGESGKPTDADDEGHGGEDNMDSSDAGQKASKTQPDSDGDPGQADGKTMTPDEVLKAFRDTDERHNNDDADDGLEALIDEIWDRIGTTKEKMEKENSEDNLDIPVPIPKAHGGNAGNITCHNIKVESENTDGYAELMRLCGNDIKMLTRSLKQIFQNDLDEYLRNTSGKYNIKRDLDHTSVKIFDKKKERKNVDDLIVMLLVDISGSMAGGKIAVARRTAVTLAETFAALKIPCYIMGFTADRGGYSVEHRHYVSFKNTKQERISLCALEAVANNDDGFSIRYAAQLLSRRRAEHKILFVISDGAPACRRYSYKDGITDTMEAIKEAQKQADVFGIGIGNNISDDLKGMYRGSYLQVHNLSELTGTLARQLKRVVRNY